jgi:PAS domain S-box-containing protein
MGNNPDSTEYPSTPSSFNILNETKAILDRIESLGEIGHWEVNLLTGKNFWSNQFFKIMGLDPATTIPSTELGLSLLHPKDKDRAMELYQKSLTTGDPYKIEKRIIRPNGESRHVISEGIVDLDENGIPFRLFGVIKDITEKKLREIELEKTTIQIENILNTTQDLIFLAEEDGTFRKVSKSCEKILGYLLHELIGKSFRNLIHPDDYHSTVENRNQVIAGFPSSDFRNRYFRKDGTVITLNWSASLDKTTNTVFGIARDVTLLIDTQEKLKQDRQKLAIVLDSSHETIWALDKEYVLLTANNHFLNTMKEIGDWDLRPGDSLIYNTPLPQKFINEWKAYYDRAFEGENFSIIRKVTLMQKPGFIEVHFKPIYKDGSLVALGCYSKDITQRKEEEIRISELAKRLTLAQKIGKLGYWEFDIQTEKIYPDPAYHEYITSQILEDIRSGDPDRMIWKNIPIVTKSDENRIITAKNIPLPNLDLMISTVVDETDAYWADHSLRINNERFHLATQAVSDAIWDWDIRKNSIFWGKGYHRLFGFPEEMEQVTEDTWQSNIHPEDFPEIWKSVVEARKNKLTDRWSVEYRFRKFDGTYVAVKENTVILRDQDGIPFRIVGSLSDISLEKQKELELQKKTSLIAAISHIIESYLETEEWEKLIDPTLKLMGETTAVDRVYFFKNFTDPKTGKLYSQQINEWTNGRVSSEIDNPDYQAIPMEDHPMTVETALKGKPFTVLTDLAQGATREILEAQGIKSLLIMPILLENNFFGFIGFDDCSTAKTWTEDEISFLASVTTNLSFAIERKQNLDKIREAFESRDSLLESIGDSFYAFDKNYVVTYWNAAIEKLTGVKAKNIIGQNIWDFVGIINTEFKKSYELAFLEGKPQYFETFDPWVKAWLEVTVYPSNGGLSVIIKDITERKNTENQLDISNERFAILSEASNDAIWDWNIQTGEHFWGEGFQKLFGIDAKLEGKSPEFWKNRVHPDDFQVVKENLNHLLNDKEETYFEIEYRFKRQDNSYAFVIDKGSVIRNKKGQTIRMVGAIQDITERKSYEESLKSLNAELAQTNTKLEASNQELEQFAYVASHDLQEPLRMISSFLGLIERKYAGILDERGHQYINFAVDGARRMREIILDLLEFSRLGNTTGSKNPAKTINLVEEVLLLNGKLIREKKAIIHIGSLPDITCHSSQIIQVFQNLISNGLKYQPVDNIPEIWIDGEEMEKEWKFTVKDNGIGIDPEFQDKIFIIFQRLHQKDQFSGSGIGLALCKKIVEFHSGKIWVESTLGAGSKFHFTLIK